jgi:CRISPR-associated protein Csb1
MSETIALTANLIDSWADDPKADDPSAAVALHLNQTLLPIGDEDEVSVVFPPTYADIGYCISPRADGTLIAQIDSVGSQNNRSEPIFKDSPFNKLVPQIEFMLGQDEQGQERRVSLLDLAHRAGDAVVRSSNLASDVHAAFTEYLRKGDAERLAKIAPTSLVYGVWDSRGTQAKRQRIIRSTIIAYDVDIVRSASQFNSVWKLLPESVQAELEKIAKEKKADLATKGYKDVPTVFRKVSQAGERELRKFQNGEPNPHRRTLGGVIANGPIVKTTTVNLIALRTLNGENDDATRKLRRYILGLALIAATHDQDLNLREGCLLRYSSETPEDWRIIPRRGKHCALSLSSKEARETTRYYAEVAAEIFGVGKVGIDFGRGTLEAERFRFDTKIASQLLAKKEEEETAP